jgi:hypothetical protein
LVYNIQSVSILGYISQLCHLPPSFPSTERGQLHALLHLPTNSTTLSFFFQAKTWGMLPLRSASATNLPALMRSALRTVTVWFPLGPGCGGVCCALLNASRSPCCVRRPNFWDTRSLASTLANAAVGFAGTRFDLAGAAALSALRRAHPHRSTLKIQKVCYEATAPVLYPNESNRLRCLRSDCRAPLAFPCL